ncbi:MAG: hypothetical protein QM755_24860 [Luteolibacter sp.]
MNRLLRWTAFSASLLTAACAEKPKNYNITVTAGPSGPNISFPESRGMGRSAKVEFIGKFRDGEKDALLTHIRSQGWKVSGTSSIGNGLSQSVSNTFPRDASVITRENIEETIEARDADGQDPAPQDPEETPEPR